MDYVFYCSEPDKVYVLSLSSFHRWEIDAHDYVCLLESRDRIKIQTRQSSSGAHVQLLREWWGVQSQHSCAHGLMVAFLTWDVSPFTLTSCGLYFQFTH